MHAFCYHTAPTHVFSDKLNRALDIDNFSFIYNFIKAFVALMILQSILVFYFIGTQSTVKSCNFCIISRRSSTTEMIVNDDKKGKRVYKN